MKKLVSIILLVTLSLNVFVGCSVEELGYVDLMQELSELDAYNVEGSFDISFGGMLEQEAGITNINSTYEMDVVNSTGYAEIDMSLDVDDFEFEKPLNFILNEDTVYIDKDLLLGSMSLANDVLLKNTIENAEFDAKLVDEKMEDELEGYEYIAYSLNEATKMDLDFDMINIYDNLSIEELNSLSKDITNTFLEYLKVAFVEFDSGFISKERSSYVFEVTPENAEEFAIQFIIYIYENKDLVYDETVTFLLSLYELFVPLLPGDIDLPSKSVLEFTLRAAKSSFLLEIDKLYTQIELLKTGELSKMFEGSYLKSEISEISNGYSQNVDIKLVVSADEITNLMKDELNAEELAIFEENEDGFVEMFTMKSESKINKLSKNPTPKLIDEDGVMQYNEFVEISETIENDLNPVESVTLIWNNAADTSQMEIKRKNGKMNYDLSSYVISENRIYLPLRQIAEMFGEEVTWDNQNKKAGVIRENTTVDMTGKIQEGSTFVKVRDFEKLGYTIEYSVDENGNSIAVITKN